VAVIYLRAHISTGEGGELPRENILALSLPLLGNLLIQLVIARVGIWALGYFSSKEIVGVYGASVQMAAIITMPLLVINSMAMPLIADMFHNQKNTEKLESVLRTITTTISAPMLLLYALIVLFGDELLALFFGDQFREGYWVLLLLATGQIGNLLAGPCGLVLKMTGFHKTLLYLNYSFGVLAVVVTFVVAKYFGAVGVAFVAMMIFAAQNIVSLYLSVNKAGVNTSIYITIPQLRKILLKHHATVRALIDRAV
jgi:O-antigen/teichoic acid export membrane protein